MAPDPNIIIVGAGIAGLSFAIMLERAGMKSYTIFERTPEIRPHGSAIVLSAIMLRCFEQLDLLDEVIEASKPTYGNVFMDEDLKIIGQLNSAYFGDRYEERHSYLVPLVGECRLLACNIVVNIQSSGKSHICSFILDPFASWSLKVRVFQCHPPTLRLPRDSAPPRSCTQDTLF